MQDIEWARIEVRNLIDFVLQAIADGDWLDEA